MEQYPVKIKSVEHVTHDVLRIQTEKPGQFNFRPGQATEISINKDEWLDERRPFTFTCLPENDFLEFTIKTYPSHNGVTNELLTPTNFARVQPGQSQNEVRALLGTPAKTHQFALKPDEEIWDWRFRDGQSRKVFSVTFGPDKAVLRSAIGDDPRDTLPGG